MPDMGPVRVLVAGQIARDLALLVDEVPGPTGSTRVRERREMLGGKGANQAVGLAQSGVRVGLLGVVGDDSVGTDVLARAAADGIDVSAVVHRAGAATGLIVSVVTGGVWRYCEDLPTEVLLDESDIARAAPALRTAEMVILQLQQPPAAVLAAARLARAAGARVVLDGAPDPGYRDALLATADVVRADAREAPALCGQEITGLDDARDAARRVLAAGPGLVAFAVGLLGNFAAWPGGELFLPLTDTEVVDTTGAGDAYVATLCARLLRGEPPDSAARWAAAAAGATVGHLGGRPRLDADLLRRQLDLMAASS